MKTAVLIDANAAAHKALYVYGDLSSAVKIAGKFVEVRTGIAYGMIRHVILMAQKFSPDRLEVIWDGGHDKRSILYPAYKKSRPSKPEDIHNEMQFSVNMLRKLAVVQRRVVGLEADDIIASRTIKLNKNGYTVIIISPDKDFKQLLRPGVKLYRQLKEGAKIYTVGDYKREYNGMDPKYFAHLLALMGDGVDGIPGVRGVGEKRALKIMGCYERPTVKNILANLDAIRDVKLQDAIIASSEELPIFLQLTKLDKELKAPKMFETLFSEEQALATLKRYKMQSLTFDKNFDTIRNLPR